MENPKEYIILKDLSKFPGFKIICKTKLHFYTSATNRKKNQKKIVYDRIKNIK